MKRLLYGIFLLAVIGTSRSHGAEQDPVPTLTIPLRFVIAREVQLERMGVPMDAWIQAKDITSVVMPELNRIWRPAGIVWKLESIVDHEVPPDSSPERQRILEAIAASHRNDQGKSDPARIPLIQSFFDSEQDFPSGFTVRLFPYLGITSQGFAQPGEGRVHLGLWSDKSSRGLRPPQKVLLAEPVPMKIGSLGRTLAHELGHNLGLGHPRDSDPIQGRLMGGKRQGYLLTPEEIATARRHASNRLQITQRTLPSKSLPLAGETFWVGDRPAFLIRAKEQSPGGRKPWVWYAPTLPNLPGRNESWMFESFSRSGIAVAGIDVGESFGNPVGRSQFSALYQEMTEVRGYDPRPVLLGRSRGGLMTLAWAAEHPEKVSGFAGIYPVSNLLSYPGLPRAARAYGMTEESLLAELDQHNPVDRLEALAKAGVPFFAIHGDVDQVVPLEANSGLLKERYLKLGGRMELIIPPGQGHNMWTGFFECQELVQFVQDCLK